MILFFQDPGDLITKGLTINPYGLTVYGALVIVLAVAVIYLWKKILADDKAYKKVLTSSTEILTSVKTRLDDQKELLDLIKEIKGDIVTIKDNTSPK